MHLVGKNNIDLPADGAGFYGLTQYAGEAEAIAAEKSNDAVQLLYPDVLKRQAAKFLDHFNGDSLYAVKANPHPAVLKSMWQSGIRHFEMASLREVEYLSNLLPDAELYFMHPVKSRMAIRRAYELGVRAFAFDCLDELRKIEEETDYANDLRLFLRIQVGQGSAVHPLSNKFGAALLEAPLLLQRAEQSCHKLGLTFHVGSQCMEPAAYSKAIGDIAQMLHHAGINIDTLDVGGGFPVSYPGLKPADLTIYFDEIHSALSAAGMNGLHLMCEPGRALTAEAGSIAVRVEMRKGQTLYLNDGTYGSLFDAGLQNWPYLLGCVSFSTVGLSDNKAEFQLFGPTCDSLDVMEGPFLLPQNIQEGDWILFKNLGAYGQALQSQFNGFYSETTVAVR